MLVGEIGRDNLHDINKKESITKQKVDFTSFIGYEKKQNFQKDIGKESTNEVINKSIEDDDLVVRVREGDNLAFEVIVDKYRDNAVLFAYQYLSDFHTAEEVVQDAFVKFYLAIDKFDSKKASLKTYLFTIVKRLCIDKKRSVKVYFVPLEEEITLLQEDTLEENAIAREECNEVLKQINRLGKNYKEALILREYENMSYEEISKVMNKNLSSIKTYIHRGRKMLLDIFRKEQGK